MIVINESKEMEIYNIVPVYRGSRVIKYLTSVSMSDINNVYTRLEYDVNTQRGERIIKNKGKVTKIEKIMSKENIEEMKIKMQEDFFDGGTLSWNVRIPEIGKEEEVIQFYPLENKIVIKAEKVTLPDSAQRHTAIWALRNKTLAVNQDTYCFPLSISVYTLAEEQSLFSEINGEGTKASKTRALYLSNAYKNTLAKEIIKNSALKDGVETVGDSIYRKNKVVAFATLYNSWFDKRYGAYKSLQEDEMDNWKSWMIRFYNELFEVRPELKPMEESDRLEWYEISLIQAPLAWYTFARISQILQNDRNWKRKLQKLNKQYKSGEWTGDLFDVENPIWHGTVMTKNKAGKWRTVNNRTTQTFFTDIVLRFLGLN